MDYHQLQGRWVLVTGASSGLGREMARQLASVWRANLILVARREAELRQLQSELEQTPGVRCKVIAADLGQPQEVERVFELASAGEPVSGVVLNAGVTYFGEQLALDAAQFHNLLMVNVSSVVRLATLFAGKMKTQTEGGTILFVSSMAGLIPLPYQAAYAGTKAYVTHFAHSFAEELRDTKVSLAVFAPGGIDTAMTRDSKLRHFTNSPLMQDAESCAAAGIKALVNADPLAVPGLLNRSQLLLGRIAPRRIVGFFTRQAYEKALRG